MSLRTLFALASAAVASAALIRPADAGGNLPIGFVIEKIESNWDHPVSLAFIDGARALVAEKPGRIWYMENGVKKNVVFDINLEVLNLLDRGMLEVAPDPHFDVNGYIYVLYAVDPNADGIDNEKESFCRLERWTTSYDASGNLIGDPNSRFDLLGDTWTTGLPSCYYSHSVGSIKFLSDGSMVITHGDAAHYDSTDVGGQDPGCFGAGKFSSDQDFGSFRAQYPNTLSGKVLRIDPATGLGLPDNPWFDGDPGSIVSREYARGLRNPFRFALMPGTGPRETLFIGDVGYNTWEEINVAKGGENFGWPCMEGMGPQTSYFNADPAGFCTNLADTKPLITWNHNSVGSLGFKGNCVSGEAFYTHGNYPPAYQNTMFFCDYGQSWINCLRLDQNLNISSILQFGSALDHPIDLQCDPTTGDLIYISFVGNGEIHRIRYIGANKPPVAVATAAPSWGATPLTVNFDASNSYDPENGALTYSWDYGDGTGANTVGDLHTYTAAQNYTAKLTVTDDNGYVASQSFLISPGNTPPSIAQINSPADGYVFTSGQAFDLNCALTDLEDDAAGIPVGAKWVADLHHEHHVHPGFAEVDAAVGTMTLASQGPATYFELTLTATDQRGLTTSKTLNVFDAAALPEPHLVNLSDENARLGQSITAVGHVDYPNTMIGWAKPTLVWDWGDGTQRDTFTNCANWVDTTPNHTYVKVGDYNVTLTVLLGNYSASTSLPVKIVLPKPAVAIYTPLLTNGFIPWDQQESIAQQIQAAMTAKGTECQIFAFDEQQALADWMTNYLDDGVRDVLIVLDTAPAKIYSGQDDGSLAELWIQHGNGLVWSGNEPFTEYQLDDGSTSATGAGGHGADDVLNAPFNSFVCRGSGPEIVNQLGHTDLPAMYDYYASYALRYTMLPKNQWNVLKLYAHDNVDPDSDAILMRHVSGGFYAQLFNADDPTLPRAATLIQFLNTYGQRSPWSPVHH